MTRLLERWGYCAVLIAAIRYFDGDSASPQFHRPSGANPLALAARVPFRCSSKPDYYEKILGIRYGFPTASEPDDFLLLCLTRGDDDNRRWSEIDHMLFCHNPSDGIHTDVPCK